MTVDELRRESMYVYRMLMAVQVLKSQEQDRTRYKTIKNRIPLHGPGPVQVAGLGLLLQWAHEEMIKIYGKKNKNIIAWED